MIIEKHSRAPRIMRLLVFFVIVLGGCKSLPWSRSVPKLTFTSPTTGNKVEASGNAAEPAKVETEKRQTEIPLPPNSQVSFVEEKLNEHEFRHTMTAVVPSQTILRSTSQIERVQQAKAFAPPSPVDLAKADGVKWFYIAGALFAVAAIAFVYLQHYKSAGISALGAFLVPTLGNLLSSAIALNVAIGLAVSAVAIYVAWYLVKNHPEIKAEAVSELAVLRARLLAMENSAKAKLESVNNQSSVQHVTDSQLKDLGRS